MDLRRHAELVYRFLGVGSVPNDTLVWIEKNNAAEAKAKETGVLVRGNRGIPFRANVSRSRYELPSRNWERRRIEVPAEEAEDDVYMSTGYTSSFEKRRVKSRAPTNGSVFGSRYLSPSENFRVRKLAWAEDGASRDLPPSRRLERRRRRTVPVNDDAHISGYASPSKSRKIERRVPTDEKVFGSRYLSPSENLRIRRLAPVYDDDLPYQRLGRRRTRIEPADDDNYKSGDELTSEEQRIKRLEPSEDNVFRRSRYQSPSENSRLRRLEPAKDDVSRSRYVKYVSPLEKWKKRLTPADRAAIVNNEICREYFRLSRTNPQ